MKQNSPGVSINVLTIMYQIEHNDGGGFSSAETTLVASVHTRKSVVTFVCCLMVRSRKASCLNKLWSFWDLFVSPLQYRSVVALYIT